MLIINPLEPGTSEKVPFLKLLDSSMSTDSHLAFVRGHCFNQRCIIGPIPWGHSGPLCHALSLLSWTLMCRRRATVLTPGKWQCGVQRVAVANGPNIFQMLLVSSSATATIATRCEKCNLLQPIDYYNIQQNDSPTSSCI